MSNQRRQQILRIYSRDPGQNGVYQLNSPSAGWFVYPEGSANSIQPSISRTGPGVYIITLPRKYSRQEMQIVVNSLDGFATLSYVLSSTMGDILPLFNVITISLFSDGGITPVAGSFTLEMTRCRIDPRVGVTVPVVPPASSKTFLLMGSRSFSPGKTVNSNLGGTLWDDLTTGSETTAIAGGETEIRAAGIVDPNFSSTLNTRTGNGNYLSMVWILGDAVNRVPLGLPAKTVQGNVTGFIKGRHSTGVARSAAIIKLYIVDPTLTVYRGTLIDLALVGNESGFLFPNGGVRQSAQIPHGASIAMSPVNSVLGDFVVIEMGYNYQNTGDLSNQSNLTAQGDGNVINASVNGDTTANLNTWISFDQNPFA